MRDEPETGNGFQREMSLNQKWRMLRMNGNPHEQYREADVGRDGRMHNRQWPSKLDGDQGRASVWAHRESTERAELLPVKQRPERNRKTVSNQGDGVEPSSNDTSDSALDGYTADRKEACKASGFSASLHGDRHRSTSRSGRGARGSVGPSGTAFMQARVEVWRKEVREAGEHFGFAYIQSPQVDCLPEYSSAGGHGAPRPARRSAGCVPYQRCRHRDSMASRGMRGNHRRAAFDFCLGGDVAPVSIPDTGIPLRQRIGIPQQKRGPVARPHWQHHNFRLISELENASSPISIARHVVAESELQPYLSTFEF